VSSFPWLLVIGAVPVVGAVVVAATPKVREDAVRWVALGVSLLTFVLTIGMAVGYHSSGDRFQFGRSYSWIPQFGVHFAVGIDGIALVMILLTAFLVPVVVIASWRDDDSVPTVIPAVIPTGYEGAAPHPDVAVVDVADVVDGDGRHSRPAGFFASILVLEAMLIGVFAATDLFLFYVFFEAMLIPMYFLIGRYGTGGAKASYAAMKFLLYSLAGGLVMLAAVIGVYVLSARTGSGSFLFSVLSDHNRLQMATSVQLWLWFGFFIAFAIKAPLWPFHTWLPDAAAEAPIGASILLVGVMDKVGTFGFLRWSLPLFPNASKTMAPLVMTLAVIGIIYGALLAIGQRDLKRLLAYTSIAHFGFIAVGIFAFTSQGMAGATLYMVNHGFSTGALFLIVGFLVARQNSSSITDFGGVHKVAPWLSGAFFIAGLSSLALPGTNSFVSEFLVLIGSFTTYRVFAIIATVGIIFAAIYILLMYQRTMHGPLLERNAGMRDLSWREAAALIPMVALILGLGFFPKPALDVINPAVSSTQHDTGQSDPVAPHPAADSVAATEGTGK
jgi:NADH-quinone oxidoreductase subunit M